MDGTLNGLSFARPPSAGVLQLITDMHREGPGFQPLLSQSSANVKFHFPIACLRSTFWTRNLWGAGALSCYPFILCHIVIIIIILDHNKLLLLLIDLLCDTIQSCPLSWVVFFCVTFHFLFHFGQCFIVLVNLAWIRLWCMSCWAEADCGW